MKESRKASGYFFLYFITILQLLICVFRFLIERGHLQGSEGSIPQGKCILYSAISIYFEFYGEKGLHIDSTDQLACFFFFNETKNLTKEFSF